MVFLAPDNWRLFTAPETGQETGQCVINFSFALLLVKVVMIVIVNIVTA